MLLLAVLFTLAPLAEAQPIVQMATTGNAAPQNCEQYRSAVMAQISDMGELPPWRIVIACDDTMWKHLRGMIGRGAQTELAFTNVKGNDGRAFTLLHGGIWKNTKELREILDHELEHVRCQCSLGE